MEKNYGTVQKFMESSIIAENYGMYLYIKH